MIATLNGRNSMTLNSNFNFNERAQVQYSMHHHIWNENFREWRTKLEELTPNACMYVIGFNSICVPSTRKYNVSVVVVVAF